MTVYGHSGYGHSGAPEVGAPKQLSVATFLSFLSTVPAYLVVVWRVTEVLLERGPVREGETWAGIYGVVAGLHGRRLGTFMSLHALVDCHGSRPVTDRGRASRAEPRLRRATRRRRGSHPQRTGTPGYMRFPLLAMAFSVIYGLLQGTAAVLLVTPSSWRYYR